MLVNNRWRGDCLDAPKRGKAYAETRRDAAAAVAVTCILARALA